MISTEQKAATTARPERGAVRRLLTALDDCDDLLQCCRMQESSTCLHRARRNPDEPLCRTCRLISAVEDLENAAQQ